MKNLLSLSLLLLAASSAGATEVPQHHMAMSEGLTATVVGARPAPSPQATETLVFDSFTNATNLTTTTGSPRTFMGTGFNVDGAGGSNPVISKLTVYLAYTGTVAQTYNTIRVRLQLWDGWSSTANPVFSSPLGAEVDADMTGPVTLNPNTFSPITVTLATPVTLTGLTSHGIAVNFQGDTGAGLASADILTSLLRYGTVAVAVGSNALTASYGYRNVANETNFNFAPSDSRSFGQQNEAMALQMFATTASPTAQTITNFSATPANPLVTDGTFAVSATGGASGNPVIFSVDAGSAAVCSAGGTNGSTITILASGTCTVLADQAGNATFSAAPQVSLPVTISKVSQTITNFTATPASPLVSDGTFTASATGGASGNPVVFSVDAGSAAVCSAGGTNGSTITILTSGTCTVLADQAGNATYSAAPQASLPVTIGNGSQTITNFAATPANPVFGQGTFTVSATGGNSGNPVVFTIDPSSAAVCSAGGTNGETISILAVGTCTVLANQAGNASYSAAPQVMLPVGIIAPGALVQDGSFEAGAVPTYWMQSSSNFGTPICDASCGGVGPRTGAFWVWFGGAGTSAEAGSVEQFGTIAAGPHALNFYVWWSSSVATPPDPAAVFNVKVDGTTIFSLSPATATAYNGGYTLTSVDISAYADGGNHVLRFEMSNAASTGSTNVNLDDISIVPTDRIFANDFE